ncbi:MAG TPA: phage tail tape measure protein, partial [Mycobacteriales bacterium]|nr:phage tail tape measure protein [Mycobacteriales bacterium]
MAGVAGFGVVAAESIKLGENYQQATAQIAASSGQTIQSAQAVANQFLKTGFASTFSAQEIATAYGGVAGQLKATEGHALSAGDAMTVMQSSMDLAEASGQSLGGTTQALAATMQAYGLKTKDASKAADQLYNISVLTNQPILGLAQVLDRLKGRLGALAPSLSDVGTLMAFPSVAAQGSRGAMVVNTALTTLLGGSKNVSKELKSLGVSIFNSSGKFIGMRGVIAQLEPKLKGMSDQQRMLAEKTLFGSSAAQLMGTIIRGGVAGYDKAAAAVNRLGSAHDAAEKQSNTLHGQTEKLKAGLEDLGVRLGEFLIPKLEKLGEIVSKTVGWFEKHKAAAIALAAIVGGALTVAFGAWAASLFMTGGALAPLIGPLGLIVVAVAAIGVAVYELYNNWSTVWDGIKSVALAVWNDGLKPVFDAIKNTVATVVGWVK